MLRHTFLHLPGVGPVREYLLWQAGMTTWEDFLRGGSPPFLEGLWGEACRLLEESCRRLEEGDAGFFASLLPSREWWRMYREFRDRAVYLDIETTGFLGSGVITLVGLYDRRGYRALVRGRDLHRLPEEVRDASLVVTYNGARFDLPFLEMEFGPLFRGKAHLDLLYPLRRLGLRGGLKRVEVLTGLARPSPLRGLDGYDAVRLWFLHQRGHRGALPTLIRYNAEDVVALPSLAALVYNLLTASLPLSIPPLEVPPRPDLGLPYDTGLVEWLREARGPLEA